MEMYGILEPEPRRTSSPVPGVYQRLQQTGEHDCGAISDLPDFYRAPRCPASPITLTSYTVPNVGTASPNILETEDERDDEVLTDDSTVAAVTGPSETVQSENERPRKSLFSKPDVP